MLFLEFKIHIVYDMGSLLELLEIYNHDSKVNKQVKPLIMRGVYINTCAQ